MYKMHIIVSLASYSASNRKFSNTMSRLCGASVRSLAPTVLSTFSLWPLIFLFALLDVMVTGDVDVTEDGSGGAERVEEAESVE